MEYIFTSAIDLREGKRGKIYYDKKESERKIMYELVKKILDEAKENNVDIGVAYNYIGRDDGYTAPLKNAFEFLRNRYEEITALRVKGKEADIKVLCDMAEQGNEEGIRNYIDQLKMDGVI